MGEDNHGTGECTQVYGFMMNLLRPCGGGVLPARPMGGLAVGDGANSCFKTGIQWGILAAFDGGNRLLQ